MTCQVVIPVTFRYDVCMNEKALQELIEHKFAPGPLLAVQGFANTYSYEYDEELLSDPETSRKWLTDAGLIDRKAKVTAEDQKELLELREAVRAMLDANHHGTSDRAAVKTLRRLAAEHPVEFEVTDEGGVELDLRPAKSAGKFIGQTVGIINQAQVRDEWKRLKICLADDCRWAFYDSSKNQGGTWCRMEVCGNRTKNRKYRQKTTD